MGSMEISLGTKSPMETFHYGEVDGGSVIFSIFGLSMTWTEVLSTPRLTQLGFESTWPPDTEMSSKHPAISDV